MSRSSLLTTGLAGAAVLIAGIALSGCSILNGFTGGVTRDDQGNVTEGNDNADVFQVKVGDCINDADAGSQITTIPVVPCDQPHDSEAYYSYLMTDSDYPGEDAAVDQADQVCGEQYEDFVGISFGETELSYSFFYPTDQSWAGGDREILCLVYDPAGPTTGSLQGARR